MKKIKKRGAVYGVIALLLLAAPRLLGAASPSPRAAERGHEAIGYAPVASVNAAVTAALVIALVCGSLLWTRRSPRKARTRT